VVTVKPKLLGSLDSVSVLLALAASLSWGVADYVGPLQGRRIGMWPVLFWSQLAGLIMLLVPTLAVAHAPTDTSLLWAIPAAAAATVGLAAYYRGINVGAMSVVAPIVGASAVIPVVYGLAVGDPATALRLIGVVAAILGIVFVSTEHRSGGRRVAAGVGLALLAAVSLGLYFPPMHVAGRAGFWWAATIYRIATVSFIFVAIRIRKADFSIERRDLPLVAAVGCGDALGVLLFAAASRHGLVSVTSVAASLYPIVTVLLAAFLLRERLGNLQRLGILFAVGGAALIAAG
jgi:drug/metabolite transporter (DMT)-like permease